MMAAKKKHRTLTAAPRHLGPSALTYIRDWPSAHYEQRHRRQCEHESRNASRPAYAVKSARTPSYSINRLAKNQGTYNNVLT